MYFFLMCLIFSFLDQNTGFVALNVDRELENTIKLATPEFASSLKRRFTNVGISEEFRTRSDTKPSVELEDTFFQDDKNQITLKNLIIENIPFAKLNDVSPNLLEKNLRLSTDWYNVTVKGFYEMTNASQLQLLPVRSAGNIEIKIEKITAKGLVGFQNFGDALKTTNFNLDFNTDNVNIQIEFRDHETAGFTKTSYLRKSIDKSLVKYFKRDLYWKLQNALRSRLDHVLVDFSMVELFGEDFENSKKYIERSQYIDDMVNKFVDKFLLEIRGVLISKGFSNITIPDVKTNFSHKFGGLTFWGTFEATNGFTYDLSHVKRTGNFSVASDPNSDDVIIWGSLGFPALQVQYTYYYARIWNIGPWGDLHATVGDNSLNFKIIANIKSLIDLDFIVKEYDFKVVQFENLKVNATGLSVVLNWLLSYIATWITGVFKQDIIFEIEEQIRTLVPKGFPVKLKY